MNHSKGNGEKASKTATHGKVPSARFARPDASNSVQNVDVSPLFDAKNSRRVCSDGRGGSPATANAMGFSKR